MPKFKHLVYVAMLEEARVVARTLDLTQAPQSLWPHSEAFSNADKNVILVTGGQDEFAGKRISRIGKASAAQMTALGIARFAPQWVWNVGTCGGISDFGAQIGDVYTGSVQQHDMHVPLPIFESYAHRVLPTYSEKSFFEKAHLKIGRISTGDSFDKSEMEWNHIRKTKADVVDMEAFAVADVVHQLLPKNNDGSLPLILLKGVTDVVTLAHLHDQSLKDAAQDFSANLKRAMQNVSDAFLKIFSSVPA